MSELELKQALTAVGLSHADCHSRHELEARVREVFELLGERPALSRAASQLPADTTYYDAEPPLPPPEPAAPQPFGARAIKEFEGRDESELSFGLGDQLIVFASPAEHGWVEATLGERRGRVPRALLERSELQPAIVVAPWEPESENELAVEAGERVSIVEQRADGWLVVVQSRQPFGPGLIPADTVDKARMAVVTTPFDAGAPNELSIVQGQKLWIMPREPGAGWAEAISMVGQHGLAPRAYINFQSTLSRRIMGEFLKARAERERLEAQERKRLADEAKEAAVEVALHRSVQMLQTKFKGRKLRRAWYTWMDCGDRADMESTRRRDTERRAVALLQGGARRSLVRQRKVAEQRRGSVTRLQARVRGAQSRRKVAAKRQGGDGDEDDALVSRRRASVAAMQARIRGAQARRKVAAQRAAASGRNEWDDALARDEAAKGASDSQQTKRKEEAQRRLESQRAAAERERDALRRERVKGKGSSPLHSSNDSNTFGMSKDSSHHQRTEEKVTLTARTPAEQPSYRRKSLVLHGMSEASAEEAERIHALAVLHKGASQRASDEKSLQAEATAAAEFAKLEAERLHAARLEARVVAMKAREQAERLRIDEQERLRGMREQARRLLMGRLLQSAKRRALMTWVDECEARADRLHQVARATAKLRQPRLAGGFYAIKDGWQAQVEREKRARERTRLLSVSITPADEGQKGEAQKLAALRRAMLTPEQIAAEEDSRAEAERARREAEERAAELEVNQREAARRIDEMQRQAALVEEQQRALVKLQARARGKMGRRKSSAMATEAAQRAASLAAQDAARQLELSIVKLQATARGRAGRRASAILQSQQATAVAKAVADEQARVLQKYARGGSARRLSQTLRATRAEAATFLQKEADAGFESVADMLQLSALDSYFTSVGSAPPVSLSDAGSSTGASEVPVYRNQELLQIDEVLQSLHAMPLFARSAANVGFSTSLSGSVADLGHKQPVPYLEPAPFQATEQQLAQRKSSLASSEASISHLFQSEYMVEKRVERKLAEEPTSWEKEHARREREATTRSKARSLLDKPLQGFELDDRSESLRHEMAMRVRGKLSSIMIDDDDPFGDDEPEVAQRTMSLTRQPWAQLTPLQRLAAVQKGYTGRIWDAELAGLESHSPPEKRGGGRTRVASRVEAHATRVGGGRVKPAEPDGAISKGYSESEAPNTDSGPSQRMAKRAPYQRVVNARSYAQKRREGLERAKGLRAQKEEQEMLEIERRVRERRRQRSIKEKARALEKESAAPQAEPAAMALTGEPTILSVVGSSNRGENTSTLPAAVPIESESEERADALPPLPMPLQA